MLLQSTLQSKLEQKQQENELHIRQVIHEANNPLTVINNYLEILSMTMQQQSASLQHIETIKSEVDRVSNILLQLKDDYSQSLQDQPEVDVNLLIPHEKVLLDKKDILKNNLKYKNDDIIISTIIMCNESNLIIDGHHRYTALKELGYSKIPVTLINYFSNKIITDDNDSLSKLDIINNSKNKSLYNPKTTKHLIYCNRNRNWLPITLISSLYLLKSNKG